MKSMQHYQDYKYHLFIIETFDKDVEKWENNLICENCNENRTSKFAYERSVANGDCYKCGTCGYENIFKERPQYDTY